MTIENKTWVSIQLEWVENQIHNEYSCRNKQLQWQMELHLGIPIRPAPLNTLRFW
jgi:phosphoglycerate-specific signal transduction histidine kinase